MSESSRKIAGRSARPLSRRSFLKLAAAGAVGVPVLSSCSSLFPKAKLVPANSRIQHACVGVGGMGEGDLRNFLQHPKLDVVALCDVDADRLAAAARLVPGARTYRDWRELLLKEGTKVDSLNVSVPDHMHFPIAYSAIKRQKHVYCQKPMCHDVAEVRRLTRAARDFGVVTQLGTQMASSVHERLAVRWLQEGVIGKVTRAYLCSNRPGAVENYRLLGPRPTGEFPPPANLDWDFWIGTAPMRPFAPDIYHPTKWRAWQDFGTGWSGDIGCHIFSSLWLGLGLSAPISVSAVVQESWKTSPARRADTWPQGNHITWLFPGGERTAGPTFAVEWFDGEFYPPEHIRKLYSRDLKEYPAESAMLIGTEGALLIPLGYPPQLLPEERFRNVPRSQFATRNHYHHFVDACFGEEQTESRFAVTGPMTETVLLGTVAVRCPGENLEWDSAALRVTNSTEANRFLRRDYREGWHFANF